MGKRTVSSENLLPQQVKLINKHEAAALLSISPATLKQYRLAKDSTLIEGIHYYRWNSRTIRYNEALIADWGLNRTNPALHQRAIDLYLKLRA